MGDESDGGLAFEIQHFKYKSHHIKCKIHHFTTKIIILMLACPAVFPSFCLLALFFFAAFSAAFFALLMQSSPLFNTKVHHFKMQNASLFIQNLAFCACASFCFCSFSLFSAFTTTVRLLCRGVQSNFQHKIYYFTKSILQNLSFSVRNPSCLVVHL